MNEGQGSGSLRYAASIALLVVTVALLGCGTLTLLPRPSSDSPSSSQLRSLQDLATAYIRVQPGETRASQLAALGFDTTTANVQVLSYLGVMERFAGDSRKFDRMDAALQECIEARDRCTALVFKPGDQRSGSGMFASFGLGSANAATREAAVTLLVQDGRVAYKAISGVPQTMLAQREPAPAPIERPRTAAIPVSARTVY